MTQNKKETLKFMDNVDKIGGNMLNRILTENDKYFMISFTCGIKKSQMHRNKVKSSFQGMQEIRERLIKGIDFQL